MSSLALSLIVKIINMKTISKKNILNFEKFQVAKLNNLQTVIGGSKLGNSNKETQRTQSTDEWTTTTHGG